MSVTITRMDGSGSITIPDLAPMIVAYYGTAGMQSHAAPGGFDDPTRPTDPYRITRDDIRVANALAAHIRSASWPSIVDRTEAIPWLQTLPADVDASRLDPAAWAEHRAGIARAIRALGLSRPRSAGITKVLHLKRPRLVPLVDSLVREQLGAPPDTAGKGAEPLLATIDHLVDQADRNRDALDAAVTLVARDGLIPRLSHLRALDIALWASHPRSAGETGLRIDVTVTASIR